MYLGTITSLEKNCFWWSRFVFEVGKASFLRVISRSAIFQLSISILTSKEDVLGLKVWQTCNVVCFTAKKWMTYLNWFQGVPTNVFRWRCPNNMTYDLNCINRQLSTCFVTGFTGFYLFCNRLYWFRVRIQTDLRVYHIVCHTHQR